MILVCRIRSGVGMSTGYPSGLFGYLLRPVCLERTSVHETGEKSSFYFDQLTFERKSQ